MFFDLKIKFISLQTGDQKEIELHGFSDTSLQV